MHVFFSKLISHLSSIYKIAQSHITLSRKMFYLNSNKNCIFNRIKSSRRKAISLPIFWSKNASDRNKGYRAIIFNSSIKSCLLKKAISCEILAFQTTEICFIMKCVSSFKKFTKIFDICNYMFRFFSYLRCTSAAVVSSLPP